MTEEICECGHDEGFHSSFKERFCLMKHCRCKKFKATAAGRGKAQNHSPQVSAKSSRCEGNLTNSPEGTQNHTRQGSSTKKSFLYKPAEKSLSEMMFSPSVTGIGKEMIRAEDVKEAVKRLKKHFELREMETISITPDEIFRVIDKIMGDNLI